MTYVNIKPKKLPKYVSKEEISIVLDNAKKDSYRNFIMLTTLWKTGLRCSELVGICKNDIQDHHLVVRNGKGHRDRVVPLDPDLENLLGVYSDNLKYNERLFKISDRMLRYVVQKNRHRDDIHTHTFRHSFAVKALKDGVNIRTLQKVLGHSSLTTTQIYLDIAGDDVADDMKKMW